MMKNAFYFTLKTLFSLKIFKFLSWLWLCIKNGSIRKIWVTDNSNHILSNISRSKGNQKLKFSQLIEYKMRNIFAEKSFAKSAGETIPRPFSKKLKLSISQDQ